MSGQRPVGKPSDRGSKDWLEPQPRDGHLLEGQGIGPMIRHEHEMGCQGLDYRKLSVPGKASPTGQLPLTMMEVQLKSLPSSHDTQEVFLQRAGCF